MFEVDFNQVVLRIMINKKLTFLSSILLLLFLTISNVGFSQKTIRVEVYNYTDSLLLEGVEIYSSKGDLLAISNKKGEAKIKVVDFPVLLIKEGFHSQYFYSEEELKPARLKKFQGTIPEVIVKGDGFDILEYLDHLRKTNIPDFKQKDTLVYYRFSYSLQFPDDNQLETATGYIAFKARGVAGAPYQIADAFRYALFTQFNYQNKDTAFTQNKRFKKAKLFSVISLFALDLMESKGGEWNKLIHPTKKKDKRDWSYETDDSGNQIFTAYETRGNKGLKTEIVFDDDDKIVKTIFYDPNMRRNFGPIKFFNDYNKQNGVNSFKTEYLYTHTPSNRLLKSFRHISTFYNKKSTYYIMKFDVELIEGTPERKYEIPATYLNANIKYPEMQGFGIYKLIENKYDINEDEFIKGISSFESKLENNKFLRKRVEKILDDNKHSDEDDD